MFHRSVFVCSWCPCVKLSSPSTCLGFPNPRGFPFDQHVRANVVTLHSHGLSVAAITNYHNSLLMAVALEECGICLDGIANDQRTACTPSLRCPRRTLLPSAGPPPRRRFEAWLATDAVGALAGPRQARRSSRPRQRAFLRRFSGRTSGRAGDSPRTEPPRVWRL